MLYLFCSTTEWIFDGIGSTIIGAILGIVFGGIAGGFIGYKVAIKNRTNQKQEAGDNSNQQQVGNINIVNNGDATKDGRE